MENTNNVVTAVVPAVAPASNSNFQPINIYTALSGIAAGDFAAVGSGHSLGMSKKVYDLLLAAANDNKPVMLTLNSVESAAVNYWTGPQRKANLPSFTCSVSLGLEKFSINANFGVLAAMFTNSGEAMIEIVKAEKEGAAVVYKRGQLKDLQCLNYESTAADKIDPADVAKVANGIAEWLQQRAETNSEKVDNATKDSKGTAKKLVDSAAPPSE